MEIERSRIIGFCAGVRWAVELAEQNRNAFVAGGEIVHNPLETRRLSKKFGIIPAGDIDAIPDNATTIIRAHGIGEDAENDMRSRGIRVIDATCTSVKRVQDLARELSKDGWRVFLFGDSGHAEVMGIIGRAQNEITVFSSADEIKKFDVPEKVALISQTTKPLSEFERAEKLLAAKAKKFKSICTICPATRNNQKAAEELAKRCDIMIVIGGRNSANTRALALVAEPFCPDVRLVESAKDLIPEWFNGKFRCGIAAGLSTPEFSIAEVESAIRKLK